MLNVLTGEQIMTHKMKPAHRVRGRKRIGEGEEGGGGGEKKEANKQIEEEADDLLKGKMLSLIDYSIYRKERQDEILSPRRPVHLQRLTRETERKDMKTRQV